MRLYIDLSPAEEANIGGWVAKGRVDPVFAAYPWRIVLEERTPARFDQIAAQFDAPPVVVPPQPTGSDFCDANEDIRWTVAWGDMTRYCTRDVRDFRFNNVCFGFIVPNDRTEPREWDGYVSLAEFDGTPAMRQMTISRSACDFRSVDTTGANGPFASVFGKQATIDFNIKRCRSQSGVALQTGTTYYVNVRNWEPATNSPSVPPIEQDYIELENGSRILRKYSAGISGIWPHNTGESP